MPRADPTFTFVTAVYNSATFLPEYLGSLAQLEGGLNDVEILFVSDGSPDESDEIVATWIARSGAPARLIRKEHGGSGSARNLGLDMARGTWVSFPDPDDVLGQGYLAAVRCFLDGLGDDRNLNVIATKVVQFADDASSARDDHILGYRYHDGPQCVHLERDPRFFHTHAPSGFYRTEEIRRAGLHIDLNLRAAFEDAAFEAEYMLGIDDPVVGIVPDAVYAYRKRPDSVIGTMWSKPERYTTVVEQGYLRLLRLRPDPPLWLQYLVLYDLLWFFFEYEQPGSPNTTIGRDVSEAFLLLLDEVLGLIDEHAVYAYPVHPLPLHVRTALAARQTGRIPSPEGRLTEIDAVARRARVSYFFVPDGRMGPTELVTLDGRVCQPLESHDRAIEYYGETFVVERELLLDADGTLVLRVEGDVLPLVHNPAGTAALFPWDYFPPAEVAGVGQAVERDSATALARLRALARKPSRIPPTVARRLRGR